MRATSRRDTVRSRGGSGLSAGLAVRRGRTGAARPARRGESSCCDRRSPVRLLGSAPRRPGALIIAALNTRFYGSRSSGYGAFYYLTRRSGPFPPRAVTALAPERRRPPSCVAGEPVAWPRPGQHDPWTSDHRDGPFRRRAAMYLPSCLPGWSSCASCSRYPGCHRVGSHIALADSSRGRARPPGGDRRRCGGYWLEQLQRPAAVASARTVRDQRYIVRDLRARASGAGCGSRDLLGLVATTAWREPALEALHRNRGSGVDFQSRGSRLPLAIAHIDAFRARFVDSRTLREIDAMTPVRSPATR